jgi:hypothetical protein
MRQSWNESDRSDDEGEIRYSLTALGEAAIEAVDARSPRFHGFGPCAAAPVAAAKRESPRGSVGS